MLFTNKWLFTNNAVLIASDLFCRAQAPASDPKREAGQQWVRDTLALPVVPEGGGGSAGGAAGEEITATHVNVTADGQVGLGLRDLETGIRG